MTLYEKLQIERRVGKLEEKSEIAIKMIERGIYSEKEVLEIAGMSMEEINIKRVFNKIVKSLPQMAVILM